METDQLGWTEAQWNRVREEVFNAWQGVRVAGSFLPVYGPLPASTKVVPSEVIQDDGMVDDQATANLLEISLPVTLTRQQVRDESLASALLQFTRRAMQVAQLEDWYIFNGVVPAAALQYANPVTASQSPPPKGRFVPDVAFARKKFVQGLPDPIASPKTQLDGLRKWNPGALGLLYSNTPAVSPAAGLSSSAALMAAVVDAISALDRQGYLGPHVCVFAEKPFTAAHTPQRKSLVLPRDRLEPLIGRGLVHASALDVLPRGRASYTAPADAKWRNRGVVLSLAGDAIDLAVAFDATAEFRYIDKSGRYVFAVFERFALRVKDPKAIVPLQFAL